MHRDRPPKGPPEPKNLRKSGENPEISENRVSEGRTPIHRRRRESRRGSRPGTGSRPAPAHPAGRAEGPTRARTKEGATSRETSTSRESTTTNSRDGQAHTRPGRTKTRESSHTKKSTKRAGPGAARRSQTHRDADKRTNRGSRHTTGRETTDKRTRAPTITTGRETHTPTDRESARPPRRGAHTGRAQHHIGSGVGTTEPERAPAGRPQRREPSIKGIGDRQRKVSTGSERRQSAINAEKQAKEAQRPRASA